MSLPIPVLLLTHFPNTTKTNLQKAYHSLHVNYLKQTAVLKPCHKMHAAHPKPFLGEKCSKEKCLPWPWNSNQNPLTISLQSFGKTNSVWFSGTDHSNKPHAKDFKSTKTVKPWTEILPNTYFSLTTICINQHCPMTCIIQSSEINVPFYHPWMHIFNKSSQQKYRSCLVKNTKKIQNFCVVKNSNFH